MIIHCFDCVLLGFGLSLALILVCGGLCYYFYQKGDTNGFNRYYHHYEASKNELKGLIYDVKKMKDNEIDVLKCLIHDVKELRENEFNETKDNNK